ncbi:YhgE/Pip family protein [Bacillota bacterium Lsc_1132]
MINILLKEELRAIFTNKKLLIPIIAVLFVPVLYSGMFLWAFWDPYSRLDQLPVAVVNSDGGAKLDGTQLRLGDDLMKKLKKSKEFRFQFVDKKAGYQGLKDQKYYMLIEIPKNFSKNATTLLEAHPKKMELIYAPNEGYNFLSAQIGGTAVEKIKTAVAQKVTETYAETMFSKVKELADGINKASDGAGQLKDGAVDVNSGTKDLNEGLSTLAKKSIEFNNGMQDANSGSKKIAAGSNDLYNGLATLAEKSIEFNNGMRTADSGAVQVAAGAINLTDGLGQLQAGQKQLTDASSQLADGSKELSAKLKEANAGIQIINGKIPALVDGTKQLQGKVDELSAGAVEINAGIIELQQLMDSSLPADQKEAAVKQGLKNLENATAVLSAGIKNNTNENNSIAGALTAINQGQMELQQGVAQLAAGSPQLAAGADKLTAGQGNFVAGMQQFAGKLAEAKAGADQLAAGSSSLSSGVTQLSDGSNAIVSGAGQLFSGSKDLETGASNLSSGMSQLADGSQAIASGAGQLASGSNQLASGTNELSGGAKELADKLAAGSKEASKVHPNQKTYQMMADPVQLDNEKINKVPNYGTGFAPYFLSLGLFVGALLISIVFPLREPAVVPASGFNWFTGKLAIMTIVGVIQALFADFILLTILGLDVQSIPSFIFYTILTSLTFVTLIQLLVSVFADAGRFLAIIILILQLTTSAGTFPLELIPNFLQPFNAYLPMTYSVQGFKAVISSGDLVVLWKNASILLFFTAIFMLGSFAYFTMRHRHDYKAIER